MVFASNQHPDEAFGSTQGSERRHRHSDDINPNNEIDIVKLRESISWSENKLRPFVDRYNEAVRFFAGKRYGDNVDDLDKTAMNLLHLAVEIWLRQLAAQTPQALVITRRPEHKTNAFELGIATNYLLEKINFGDSLSDCVKMAIFQMGVMKIGITSPYFERKSWADAAGQPYAEPVLFEDWIHDMTARRKEEWDWCGNRYRMPYEYVMDNKNFSRRVKDRLKPAREGEIDIYGRSQQRTSKLSAGEDALRSEYREQVDLIDLWLPSDGLFVTLPGQHGLPPLEVKEWEGPDNGPYHILGFSKIPGSVVPGAPAQHIYEMQDLITRMFNQLARQALRQKTLTIVDGRADADGTGERIMEGQDGQVIRTSHVDSVREMKYGGVDPGNHQFLVYAREVFSYLGGNIDAMGGLAQQAGTLGQEELLVQSSSEMIRDMQSKVLDFTKNVTKDLAWYLYTDPFIELPLVKKIEGYGDIAFTYGPDKRKADFFDYNFSIQPHSLQHKGPAQRLQTIMGLMTNVILPLVPQFEQLGITLNLQKFVELISKYGDLPEIHDILVSELPTPYEEMIIGNKATAGDRPTQSPVTQRNYTRTNIPTGGTQKSRDAELQKQLASAAQSNENKR